MLKKEDYYFRMQIVTQANQSVFLSHFITGKTENLTWCLYVSFPMSLNMSDGFSQPKITLQPPPRRLSSPSPCPASPEQEHDRDR